MKMSCNGCRVLRKGCSDDCTIRPCLQWIKSPESQANATLFLTKFYGRAGLINLIEAGPPNLRPAIFRSLLYEACGRVANPVSGSVGLLWSGNWALCQAAVEAVFGGSCIMQVPSSFLETEEGKGLQLISNPPENCGIRHVPENRRQPKRSIINLSNFQMSDLTVKISSGNLYLDQTIPHPVVPNASSETVEDSLVNRVNRHGVLQFNDHRDSEGGLDLSLGFCPPPSQMSDFLRQSNAGVLRQTRTMI